jgi:hypothetical protein
VCRSRRGEREGVCRRGERECMHPLLVSGMTV